MKKISLKSMGIFFSLLICFGCADGNCRSQSKASSNSRAAMTQKAPRTAQDSVKIYKYDGSLQCGQGKKISLEEMQKELQGISVYSSKNQPDGLMRTQVCGAPTGRANVYEIDRSQLTEAKKRGFKEWTFD
jgi:hypothetical protein